jgi:hypothetical protein
MPSSLLPGPHPARDNRPEGVGPFSYRVLVHASRCAVVRETTLPDTGAGRRAGGKGIGPWSSREKTSRTPARFREVDRDHGPARRTLDRSEGYSLRRSDARRRVQDPAFALRDTHPVEKVRLAGELDALGRADGTVTRRGRVGQDRSVRAASPAPGR